MIGVGAESGASVLTASKSSSGSAVVVPIGLSAAYRTWNGTFFNFSLRLSGGPAVFIFLPQVAAAEIGMVPYVTGGVGIALSLLPNLVMDIDVAYTCLFVTDLIMGFSPSITFGACF